MSSIRIQTLFEICVIMSEDIVFPVFIVTGEAVILRGNLLTLDLQCDLLHSYIYCLQERVLRDFHSSTVKQQIFLHHFCHFDSGLNDCTYDYDSITVRHNYNNNKYISNNFLH